MCNCMKSSDLFNSKNLSTKVIMWESLYVKLWCVVGTTFKGFYFLPQRLVWFAPCENAFMWMVLYMAFLSLLFSCIQHICYKWQSYKSREQVTLHCLYVCHCLFLIVDWVNRTILVANFCFGFRRAKLLRGN